MENFNQQNPEQLTYQNDLLKITVLGGIKLEGLDRLRTTLKIELKNSSLPAVRHSLDLYNDTQLEKFIRKVAQRLETGTSLISASISELTEQLENYRIEKLKEKQPDLPQRPTLSAEDTKAALDFLKQPNLLDRSNEMIGKSGMIGEVDNRLLMYLIFTSRKRERPLHVVSLGASGTGKTHLQEKVGELIPQEDKIEITTLSENAFYYFGQRELKHKLILIEDLDGAESSLYPLRELQSKKRISKTIAHKTAKGETKTVHLVVEGPVSVGGCTTREQIYEDNANRSFLIYLDESQTQTDLILGYQRAVSAGKVNYQEEEQAAELLRNCQRLLESVKVINPYAELLNIPQEVLKPRRTNTHYLQFIEVVTYYNQFQRVQKVDKQTGEIYIETTLEDIQEANKLLAPILLRKSDTLTGACRNYLESVKQYLEFRNNTTKAGRTSSFTSVEIRKALKVNTSNQKRYTAALLENFALKRTKLKKQRGYVYQVVSYEEYQELKQKIHTVLDDAIKQIQQAKGPIDHQKSTTSSGLLQVNDTVQLEQKSTKSTETKERGSTFLAHEQFLKWLRTYINSKEDNRFYQKEVAEKSGKSIASVKAYLKKLLTNHTIEITHGTQQTGYVYGLVEA